MKKYRVFLYGHLYTLITLICDQTPPFYLHVLPTHRTLRESKRHFFLAISQILNAISQNYILWFCKISLKILQLEKRFYPFIPSSVVFFPFLPTLSLSPIKRHKVEFPHFTRGSSSENDAPQVPYKVTTTIYTKYFKCFYTWVPCTLTTFKTTTL